MTAVISSAGLGLFNSSISDQGNTEQTNLGQASNSYFVNAATGNLVVQSSDDSLSAQGIDIDVLRTYNSQDLFGDNVGQDSWRLGFLSSIKLTSGSLNNENSIITRISADGYEQQFTHNGTEYISKEGSGAHDTLVVESNKVTITEGTSLTSYEYQTIANGGKLIALLDKNGNGQHYQYQNDRLTAIFTDTDNANIQEKTLFNYDDTHTDWLTSIVFDADGAGNGDKSIYYRYNINNQLESVTYDLTPSDGNIDDGDIYTVTYIYHDNSNLLKSVSQSDGSEIAFTYHPDGKVASVTVGNDTKSSLTSYVYNNDNTADINTDGQTVTVEFDSSFHKRLLSTISVESNQEIKTSYLYDDDGNVVSVENGLGNKVTYVYQNGNQISQTDALGNSVTRKYNSHNQLLAETHNDQSSYFIYDDNNDLRFTISATAGVTEFTYNTLGQLILTEQYAKNSYTNFANLSSTQLPILSELDTWASAIKTADVGNYDIIVSRNDYDFRGNLEKTTVYEEVDNNGAAIISSGQTATYIYDMHGRLTSQTTSEGRSTSFAYDGLGRLSNQHANNIAGDKELVTQTYIYDGDNNKVSIETQNGLLTTRVFDSAGRLVSVQYGSEIDIDSLGKEAFFYNKKGQKVAQQHTNGATSYSIYDNAGRQSYAVDRAGVVTKFDYDNANQLIATTQYSTPFDTTAWFSSGNVIDNFDSIATLALTSGLVTSEYDRGTAHYYDTTGRKVLDVDAAGFKTEYRYDSMGRLTHTLAYANANDIITDDASGTFTATIADDTVVSRHFYNDSGRLIASIDGEGYVTQYYYDNAGNKTGEYSYASSALNSNDTELSSSQIVSNNWNEFKLTANNSKDHISHYRYNGNGLLHIKVTSEGQITKYTYNDDGLLSNKRIYANRHANVSINSVITIPANLAKDKSVDYTYTDLGKLETESNGFSKATYHYDAQGQLIGQSVSNVDGSDTKTTLLGKDLLGRDIGTLNGEESINNDINQTAIAVALSNDGSDRVFDDQGRLVQVIDHEGNKIYNFYDERNLLKATVNSDGSAQYFEYNSFGELTLARSYASKLPINALSNVTGNFSSIKTSIDGLTNYSDVTNSYTKRGLLDITEDATNGKVDNDYDAFGQIDKRTTYLNNSQSIKRVDEFNFNNKGLLIGSVVDFGGENIEISTIYDAFGRVITSIDANQAETNIAYNDHAGTVITTFANNSIETISYDVFARKVSIEDATNKITNFYYKGENEQITTNSQGQSTQIIYNAHGDVTDIIKGLATDVNQEAGMTKVITTENTFEHTHFTFDKNGNQLTQVRGYGSADSVTVSYTYNDNNQRISETVDPDGIQATTLYTYDATGRVSSKTDAMGYVTRYVYDGKGQLTHTIDNANTLTIFTYDDAGRKTSVAQYHESMGNHL